MNTEAGNNVAAKANNESQDPTKITIKLSTTAYFMSGIRDFTLGLIKNTTNFGEKWAYRFQSIVDELCNNAIEFGSAKGEEITIIFFNKPEDYIKISVEDTGTGQNKAKAEDLYKLLEERSKPDYTNTGLRGRGLPMIVRSWSDELTFEDVEGGGIRATVTKSLKVKPKETGGDGPDPTKINL
jgi:anti-sigma regulatory factor (Ser/Thr protein kinase)